MGTDQIDAMILLVIALASYLGVSAILIGVIGAYFIIAFGDPFWGWLLLLAAVALCALRLRNGKLTS